MSEKIKELKIKLPACWASYLINGDWSGLDQSELEECDLTCKDLGYCVDCSDTETKEYNGLLTEVLTYTFHKQQ